ncbi:hypothetical protein [Streptomyces wuyuanensis]|uniref:hypothetical protein n=1 Tax=Streptomyces wuyuanensis TaxID=1196353 RepID=UPI003710412F
MSESVLGRTTWTTLATALYETTDDMPKERPDTVPWRLPVGIAPRLSDAELVNLATMQAMRSPWR